MSPKQVRANPAWLCCEIAEGPFNPPMMCCPDRLQTAGRCSIPAGAQGTQSPPAGESVSQVLASSTSLTTHPIPLAFPLHPSELPTGTEAMQGGTDRQTGLSLQPLREPS